MEARRDDFGVGVGVGVGLRAKDTTTTGAKAAFREGEISLAWTVAYYVLLFAGALGFSIGLWPLTESKRALASF